MLFEILSKVILGHCEIAKMMLMSVLKICVSFLNHWTKYIIDKIIHKVEWFNHCFFNLDWKKFTLTKTFPQMMKNPKLFRYAYSRINRNIHPWSCPPTLMKLPTALHTIRSGLRCTFMMRDNEGIKPRASLLQITSYHQCNVRVLILG